MIDTAVILAAGRGSRLDQGREQAFSKPLIRVAGQTLLERTVRCCRAVGVRRILVATGYRADLICEDLRQYDEGDLETVDNVHWQRANGVSLYVCRERVRCNFLLMMADHLFETSILADLAALPMHDAAVVLAVDGKIDDVFDLDDATKVWVEQGRIRRIHKQLTPFNAVDCGLFACTPELFDALGEAMVDGDCSLSDGMAVLGRRGRFAAYDIGVRRWQDVDTPEMLAEAERRFGRS